MSDINKKDVLLRELIWDFKTMQFEDGIHHKAEETLRKALENDDEEILDWLVEFSTDEKHPATSAGILRCIGRQDKRPGSLKWRENLIKLALQSNDIEIRDAAVIAVEDWDNEKGLIDVLKEHNDEDSYIQSYIDAVVSYMEEYQKSIE